tara:strand:+ start:4202 stop:5290 length:1089 start_codon:yes stop_codon:yes gene_type:complete
MFLIKTLLALLCFSTSFFDILNATEKNNTVNEKNTYTTSILNYRYKLGSGDVLEIKLANIKGFNNTLKILPDGTINLPRVGSVYISGMTIGEATLKIQQELKSILRYPQVFLNLLDTRPIKVSVIGEVQKPGIYSISKFEINELSNSDGVGSSTISSKGWPTVIDALQKAGGVTSVADLRGINLSRYIEDNSSPHKIELNYWNILKNGEKIVNPLIYDGDIIKVKKIAKPNTDETILLSKSNFAPSTLAVNVIGEVSRPGVVNVRSGAPLSEAIFAAGGLTQKAKKTDIKFFRLKENGSVKFRKLKFSPNLALGDRNNPSLNNRDVILVGKNSWTKLTSKLGEAVQPLSPLLQAAAVYKLFE